MLFVYTNYYFVILLFRSYAIILVVYVPLSVIGHRRPPSCTYI